MATSVVGGAGNSEDLMSKLGAVLGGGDGAEAAEPEEQDPYADKEKINERIEKLLEVDKYQRSLFEREWFRNILFSAGQQWIIYEKGQWRPRKLPAWFPRAQTNKFYEKANDLISSLVQGDVPLQFTPATDRPEDISTAEIGERIKSVIFAETRLEDKKLDMASWLVHTGNVFLVLNYDMDEKHGMQFVQSERCIHCGSVMTAEEIQEAGGFCPTCAENGEQNADFTPASVPAEEGAEGEPEQIGEDYPIGSMVADVASPFEIGLDHRIRYFEDQQRFVRKRRYDLEYAKDHWGDKVKGDFEITADSGNDLSQYYLDVLAHVTSSFTVSGGLVGGGDASNKKQPKVTAYEFYELPSEDFPQGIRAVRIGKSAEGIVEAGPLPTEYGAGVKKGQKFLPLIHFGFDVIPGRMWRKTRLDDLIPLQIFRNTIEANMRLSIQRMGNAVWLNPKGSGVSILTGEPGQQVDYNPVSLGGTSFAKPERMPAELNHLQALTMMLNKIDDSMERVAGTFFLQGGETPPGVTAASALAYLGERAQKSMSPLLREWAKGFKRFTELAIEIARSNWDDSRIRVIAGRNRKWETEKFIKDDISGAVNIEIDYNGLFPKSQATERATIQQLIAMGVLNPQDPETEWQILSAFGETKLKGSVDLDMKEATKEYEKFLDSQGQALPSVVPMVQNSMVHLLQHTDAAKTDEFKELDPQTQQAWFAHIQAHVQDIIARRMMFASAGMNPDTPGTEEFTSGQAGTAAQAAAQFGANMGGQASPDAQIGKPAAGGGKKPKPGEAAPETLPDIAGGAAEGAAQGISQPSPAQAPQPH